MKDGTFIAPIIEPIQGEVEEDTSLSIGAYKQDGEIYVYVDGFDPSKLQSYSTKQAAYEYRLSIGMSHSGIGIYGTPFIVGPKDKESKLVKQANASKKQFVYRQLYKLTPML